MSSAIAHLAFIEPKNSKEKEGLRILDQLEFLADTEKLIKENMEQKVRIEELEKKLGRR